MSIPIWVTDPTGNNNPFLKIIKVKGPYFTWMTRSSSGGATPTIEQVVNSTLTGSSLYDTTFTGPDFTNVNGFAIQDDGSNIYLVKRDSTGTVFHLDGTQTPTWSMPLPVANGPFSHMAIDDDGNLLVLGPNATKVQKYAASDGSFMLEVSTGGSLSSYRINFCSDRSSNIIVATMASAPSHGPATTVIVKYDSQGNVVWSNTFKGLSVTNLNTIWGLVRNMANAPNGDIYWDDFVSITCISGGDGTVRWQQNYSNISQPDPINGNGPALEGFGIDTDLAGAVYVATASGVKTDNTSPFKSYSYGNIISYALDGTVQQNIPVRLSIEEFAISSNSIFIATDAGQLDGVSDFLSSGWGQFSLTQGSNGNFTVPNDVASITNYTITAHQPTSSDPISGLAPTNVWSQQVT